MILLLCDGVKIDLAEPLIHLDNIGTVNWGTEAIFEMIAQNSEVFETCDLLLFFIRGTELLVGPLTHRLTALTITHRDLRLGNVFLAHNTSGTVFLDLLNN